MATPCFVANWKMNKTLSEACDYLAHLQQGLKQEACKALEMILAPSYVILAAVAEQIRQLSLPIALAAQNLHHKTGGAYTGEVSGTMLREAGCRYVIIGHSERRVYFGETDAIIAEKVAVARGLGLVPILCVGESAEERENHKTELVVRRQLQVGLELSNSESASSRSDINLSDCLIAYEPVWAIGSGKTPTSAEVEQVHCTMISCMKSAGVLEERMPRLLYGGSVDEKNIATLMKEPHVDGVLAGGASLAAERFMTIMELGRRAKNL